MADEDQFLELGPLVHMREAQSPMMARTSWMPSLTTKDFARLVESLRDTFGVRGST